MPQVRKPAVDARIRLAALQCFAEHGYEGTSMAALAESAGVSAANIYRYYPDGKAQLFDAVVTDEVADTHEALIVKRVQALLLPLEDNSGATGSAAQQLLDFWVDHRLEVVILLGRTDGTRLEGYGARFVQLLVHLAMTRLREAAVDITPTVRHLLDVIFDNTRRALVAFLTTHHDEQAIRRAVGGFWSYQLPGLDGFYRWAQALNNEVEPSHPHSNGASMTALRSFQPSDLEAVVELSLRAWAPVFDSLEQALGARLFRRLHPEWQIDQQQAVEAACQDEETSVWVAEHGSIIVGFVVLRVDQAGSVGEIYMVAVDPAHQRRGIGTALTAFAVEQLKEAGMAVAMVETGGDPGHAPARATYQRAGFTHLPIARYFKPL